MSGMAWIGMQMLIAGFKGLHKSKTPNQLNPRASPSTSRSKHQTFPTLVAPLFHSGSAHRMNTMTMNPNLVPNFELNNVATESIESASSTVRPSLTELASDLATAIRTAELSESSANGNLQARVKYLTA